MIFLVITADEGSAIATSRPLDCARRSALDSASATASGFSIVPSTIAPRSTGSIA